MFLRCFCLSLKSSDRKTITVFLKQKSCFFDCPFFSTELTVNQRMSHPWRIRSSISSLWDTARLLESESSLLTLIGTLLLLILGRVQALCPSVESERVRRVSLRTSSLRTSRTTVAQCEYSQPDPVTHTHTHTGMGDLWIQGLDADSSMLQRMLVNVRRRLSPGHSHIHTYIGAHTCTHT